MFIAWLSLVCGRHARLGLSVAENTPPPLTGKWEGGCEHGQTLVRLFCTYFFTKKAVSKGRSCSASNLILWRSTLLPFGSTGVPWKSIQFSAFRFVWYFLFWLSSNYCLLKPAQMRLAIGVANFEVKLSNWRHCGIYSSILVKRVYFFTPEQLEEQLLNQLYILFKVNDNNYNLKYWMYC